MIPQMIVVADLTRGEDWLSLKPGDAVGDCFMGRFDSMMETGNDVLTLGLGLRQGQDRAGAGAWVGATMWGSGLGWARHELCEEFPKLL